ncbi:hypothetical protein PWT90_06714 [Aphanocladium album]|nr:hypothetical protein PWT90_06714 [Aphanocladium album]
MSELDSAIDIDSWRHSVPSRLEREDPFANDGFGERPATRLTFREQEPPEVVERPVSRFSLFRSKLFTPKRQPQHGYDSDDESTIYQRPDTALSTRTRTKAKTKKKNRGFFASFFHRGKKRSRDEYEEDEYYGEEEKEITLVSAERSSTVVEPWKFTAENLFSKSKTLPPALYLVGTKKDLRHRSASRRFSLGYYYYNQQLLPASASVQSVMAATCVSSAQAMWQAKYLKARYFECSALTGEGVDLLVEETAAEATRAVVEKEYALYRGIKRMALSEDED